jgi:hypothetical protein
VPRTNPAGAPVIPFPTPRPARTMTGPPAPRPAAPDVRRAPIHPDRTGQDLSDMEIPTFIRRQMD